MYLNHVKSNFKMFSEIYLYKPLELKLGGKLPLDKEKDQTLKRIAAASRTGLTLTNPVAP